MKKEKEQSDITEAQLSNEMEVLAKLRTALSEDIARFSGEFTEIQKEITLTMNQKVTAKKNYEDKLDQGDQQGMDECLQKIREANEQVKNLKEALKRFPSEIENFYRRHKELLTQARNYSQKRRDAWMQAEKTFRVAEAETERCHHLLSGINELNNLVGKGENSAVIKEPKNGSPKKLPGNI